MVNYYVAKIIYKDQLVNYYKMNMNINNKKLMIYNNFYYNFLNMILIKEYQLKKLLIHNGYNDIFF
jgi:hypothetical protein